MFDRALNALMCVNCLLNVIKRYFKFRQINWQRR